jgi:hypothetical protein
VQACLFCDLQPHTLHPQDTVFGNIQSFYHYWVKLPLAILGTAGKVIVKLTLKKQEGRNGHSSDSAQRLVIGSCEHGHETSDPIQYWVFK